MNEITTVNNSLPTTIEDLSKFVLIGREKLVAVRAEIRAIQKVGLAQEVREQKLAEAQEIAEAVLDAEVRIGELMAQVPKATKGNQYTGKMVVDSSVHNQTKTSVIEQAGFTPKQVQRFETLAKHPEIVAQAKAEARENDDVVSRSLALTMIRNQEKAEQRAEKMSALKEKAAVFDGNIVNGDCIAEMEKLADGSVDCVVTDPPYGIEYVSNRRTVESEVIKPVANDGLADALALWENACNVLSRKMKDNSHIYIFTSWKVYPQFAEITGRYFRIKNCLIWRKNNHGTGDLEGNYSEQYEMIIFATKGNRKLNGGRDSNILEFDKVASANLVHSCEKPVDLLEFLIEKSTDEGEMVIDPFAGSGSTLVAAKNKNRQYWGCELDTENYRIACGRCSQG